MKERRAFDLGVLAGVFLSVAGYSGNWLLTPMRHPDASAFQRRAVVIQGLVSLAIALFLILRRRPRPSSPPAADEPPHPTSAREPST